MSSPEIAYTDDFYGPYSEYLKDSKVQAIHHFAIETLCRRGEGSRVAFNQVVDFGCGLREFELRYTPTRYLGIDLRAPEADVKEDYRLLSEDTVERIRAFEPKAFVSLFSADLSAGEDNNWCLYNSLFETFPSIQMAMVSGCYYRGLWDHILAPEVCGTQSYQTTQPLGYFEHEPSVDLKFKEQMRLTLPCPSEMFGPDEIEVWRKFVRCD